MKSSIVYLSIVNLLLLQLTCAAHEIIFCGEKIPVENNFVANKLMNIIKKQLPYVNLPQLRKRVEANFPVVEYYLRKTGLPEDFKYLAIVESGFQNLTSIAGARGFWQLMPETARELGLIVSEEIDERDDLKKSTYAACKVLASYYLKIRKTYGVSSWVLTAAAYNFGIGNISSAINKQGNDYFSMNLNQETALYVYKIIAVKELFEYPELYIKDFGYNFFRVVKTTGAAGESNAAAAASLGAMTVNVQANDGKHPDDLKVKEAFSTEAAVDDKTQLNKSEFNYVGAKLKGKYANFADGGLITIQLLENMETKGAFNRKGNLIRGQGWLIGERIFVDLGYGDHDVVLVDEKGNKGIVQSTLSDRVLVLIKIRRLEE